MWPSQSILGQVSTTLWKHMSAPEFQTESKCNVCLFAALLVTCSCKDPQASQILVACRNSGLTSVHGSNSSCGCQARCEDGYVGILYKCIQGPVNPACHHAKKLKPTSQDQDAACRLIECHLPEDCFDSVQGVTCSTIHWCCKCWSADVGVLAKLTTPAGGTGMLCTPKQLTCSFHWHVQHAEAHSSCQLSPWWSAPAHCAQPHRQVGVLQLTGLMPLCNKLLPRSVSRFTATFKCHAQHTAELQRGTPTPVLWLAANGRQAWLLASCMSP